MIEPNPSMTLPNPAELEFGWPARTEAMTVVGELFWHAERGVVRDLFDCYGRLCRLAGRTVDKDVPPTIQMLDLKPLIPLSVNRLPGDRIAILNQIVGPALRNANALDASRHWLTADAHMKGFALSEARFQEALAVRARHEAILARERQDVADAEERTRFADERIIDASYFELLASGEGW